MSCSIKVLLQFHSLFLVRFSSVYCRKVCFEFCFLTNARYFSVRYH